MEASFNAIPIWKAVLTIYYDTEGRISTVSFISSLQKYEKNPHLYCYTMPVKPKSLIPLSRYFILNQDFGTWFQISVCNSW